MAATGVSHTDPAERAIAFAGVILLLIGILSVVQGVAALVGSSALVDAPDLIVFGSSTWGTMLVLLGVGAALIAMTLWTGAAVRGIGVALAAANGFVQALFMPAFPLWALTALILDMVAIFALVVLVANARGERS
jgi:hypothetical protein